MQNIKKLSNLLTSNERFRTMLLLAMVLIMAFIEMLGIASIMPFIAVMSNPELVETNTYLNSGFKLASNFGIETNLYSQATRTVANVNNKPSGRIVIRRVGQ